MRIEIDSMLTKIGKEVTITQQAICLNDLLLLLFDLDMATFFLLFLKNIWIKDLILDVMMHNVVTSFLVSREIRTCIKNTVRRCKNLQHSFVDN